MRTSRLIPAIALASTLAIVPLAGAAFAHGGGHLTTIPSGTSTPSSTTSTQTTTLSTSDSFLATVRLFLLSHPGVQPRLIRLLGEAQYTKLMALVQAGDTPQGLQALEAYVKTLSVNLKTHGHAQLAADIQAGLTGKGKGHGALAITQALSLSTGLSLQTLVSLKAVGIGWGELASHAGLNLGFLITGHAHGNTHAYEPQGSTTTHVEGHGSANILTNLGL